MTQLTLIAALARNRSIGLGGRMPWHLPADLRRFKRITMGHPVIMGRKTFESIGRPLPGRSNIVISRTSGEANDTCVQVRSLDEAMRACANAPSAFVIGGGEIYSLALARAQHMALTVIDADFPGDAFFPVFDAADWQEVAREHHHHDGTPAFDYAFVDYDRRVRL